MSDPLATLSAAGVSVWLDDLSRNRIESGNLAGLIRDLSVVGVTTNPTIFQKALADGDAYDGQVKDLATRGVDVGEAVRAITTMDVRNGCDILRPVFDASEGRDGRVSIEVDPRIGHDTGKTIAEARALWWMVDRPNLLIKIPATLEGLPAIAQVISEGISVNVTLIFSLERYRGVLDAYLDGMQRRHDAGGSLVNLESVASFFVSRVDTEIDDRLDAIGTPEATALKGKAAVANARLAYQVYEEFLADSRWQKLSADGGKAQRPLWASTGVKNPDYDDTMYVVDLVAPDTVNTMPEATMRAVFDHGVVPAESIRGHYGDAMKVLDSLKAVGIDYDDVVKVLEDEGVDKFEASWNQLIDQVTRNLEDARPASTGVDPAK